jgi:hypothetical protein
VPPPVIVTVPLAGWVTDVTLIGPPSGSVSLASTSMALAPESSVTVAASSTAVGSSSTQVTVTVTVAVEPPLRRVGEGVERRARRVVAVVAFGA